MGLTIITRAGWGARPYSKPPTDQDITPASTVFLHHSVFPALPASATRAQEIARMKQIEATHMDGRGWIAVGYSYVVFPSGRVYTGRGFSHVPAAQSGHNTGNGAICLDGNYDETTTTWAQRLAIVRLLRERFHGGRLGVHQDVNPTGCPGANVKAVAGRIAFLSGLKRL